MTRTQRTEAEELELQRLIAEQARDDSDTQRPQEFGGAATVPLLAPIDEGPTSDGDDDQHDEYLVSEGFEDALIDHLVGETPPEESSTTRLIASVVADLPVDLRETYDALYVQRLTTREAGALLGGISHVAVQKRARRLQEAVADALAGEVADA